jgi:hypothetical protein
MSTSSNKSDASCLPVIQRMADIQPEAVEWLWPGRIAIGKVTLIYGDPGLGKSFVTLDMAARVSCGAAWPDNEDSEQPVGGVVLLSAEDDAADTIRPRLDAHRADTQRICLLKAVHVAEGDFCRSFDLGQDIDALRKAIDQTPGCRLVIVDPISAYLGKADSNVNTEVRRALTPLSELAAEKRVAIVAVSHLRKGDGTAVHRAIGSIGFVAAARAAWVVIRDSEDSRRRFLLVAKNNLADDSAATGLAYSIEGKGPGDAPVVCWDPDPVTISADEALAAEPEDRGRPAHDRANAMAFLCEALFAGPRKATELVQEAEANHISKRTLERAKQDLGVKSFQPEIPGPWYWKLSYEPPQQIGDVVVPLQQSCQLGDSTQAA